LPDFEVQHRSGKNTIIKEVIFRGMVKNYPNKIILLHSLKSLLLLIFLNRFAACLIHKIPKWFQFKKSGITTNSKPGFVLHLMKR
jgi:hypothetical protein